MFREIHRVRDFRLVLCADVWYRAVEYSVRVLIEAVAAERAERGFDTFFPEPSVVYMTVHGSYKQTFRRIFMLCVLPSPWPYSALCGIHKVRNSVVVFFSHCFALDIACGRTDPTCPWWDWRPYYLCVTIRGRLEIATHVASNGGRRAVGFQPRELTPASFSAD